MNTKDKLGAGTLSVWAGEDEPDFWQRATQVPVVHSVAFGYRDVDEWQDVATGKSAGHIYGRNTNPTVHVFEEKVRVLERAEAATSFATGMAAISSSLHALVAPGDRVVSIRDTYGGTNRIFDEFLPRFGVECILCDTADHDAIEREVARGCRVLYLETPTNPTLKVLDIRRLADAGRAAGATVVVDNTFPTPVNSNPLLLGADLVVHSATKFLGGHADALGGVVCGSRDLVGRIYHYREINGAALHPMAAYLLLRGMKTLQLRVGRQASNALAVAQFLEAHPRVVRVNYPGLASHPGHEVARRQMSGFGGMLSFELGGESGGGSSGESGGESGGGFNSVREVVPRLRLAHAAANLGAVETTVGPPATTSHVELTREQRAALGIPEGLIRYSAGIEDEADLIADLEQALAR